MISSIRRQFTGVAYKSILWLIIFAFIAGLMVVPGALRYASTGGPWVIRVNGEDIGYNDFAREVREKQRWLASLHSKYGQYADVLLMSMGLEPDPRSIAFHQLTRNELMSQFADSLGVYLHSDFITGQLSNPYFVLQELSGLVSPQVIDFQTGIIDTALLKKTLQYQGMNIEEFESKLSRILINKIAMEVIGSAFYMPLFDLKQLYQNEYAAKTFDVFEIPFEPILESVKQKPITNSDLKHFFEQQNQQKKRYWVPEKRDGLLWKFDPATYDIEVSEDQIKSYYETNKTKLFIEKPVTVQIRRILIKEDENTPREQALTKMQLAHVEVKNAPNRFAEIARQYSDDKETAQDGGLVSPFARGEKEPALERAAFLLPEDGAVSEVIQTKEGFEIIQRVHKEKPVYKSLASARNEIKETLIQKQFNERFVKDMKQIIELPVQEREVALKKLIKEKGGKPKTLTNVPLDDSSEAKALFKLEKNAVTFYVDEADGVALKLTGIKQTYLPELNTIKKTVQEDLYEGRARAELKKQLQQVKESTKTAPLNKLKESFNARLTTVGPIKGTDTEKTESLDKKGLPIKAMMEMEKEGALFTQEALDKGFVVRLRKVDSVNFEQFTEKRDEIESKFLTERMRLFTEGFVASLYRNAKIETNESVLTQP